MAFTVTISRIRYLLFLLVFLSTSFDVLLNIKIGGFSFRFVYIIILILFVVYLLEAVYNNIFYVKVLGLSAFLFWSFFLIIFIPNTPLIGRNIGYMLWLYIHFVFIIVNSYYGGTRKSIITLTKLYLLSFLLNGLFGFAQFILGIAGFDLLVEQWWIPGRLPRLNGFSYEPSYYSTYLIIGFSLSYYLYRVRVNVLGKVPKYTVIVTGLAIILSTSRMGILIAFIEILCFELFVSRKNVRQILLFTLGFGIVVVAFGATILLNSNLSFLLAGLGIMGGSAHSSLERLDGFMTQLEIFSRSPFKGYSLGGVSQAIAFEKGVTSISQETIKLYDISINIFVEVLTASGLLGFIFFLRYIYCLLIKSLKVIDIKNKNDEESILMKAFIWSLLMELIILCFNQNVLRAYLWVHIAMLNAVYFYLKSHYKENLYNAIK